MTKLRIGIIGTSNWVEMMYLRPLSTHDGAVIAAICGRNLVKTASVARTYGVEGVFTDWRQMLEEAALDAIAIVSPEELHCEMAVAALDRGLHVLCEKPLANSAGEAWEMVAAAQAAGTCTLVYFTWRWQPHFKHLKTLLEQGEYGKPRRAELSFRGGFVLDNAYHWRLDAARAKGTVADLGAHMLDLGHWYFGVATSVTADTSVVVDRTHIPGHEGPVANDAATLLVNYASGVHTVMDVSAATPVGDRHMDIRVRVECENGVIAIDQVFRGSDAGVVFRAAKGTAPFQDVVVPQHLLDGNGADHGFDYYLKSSSGVRYFVDCLLAHRVPSPDFLEGAVVQDIIDAAMISALEGRRIELPHRSASAVT